MKQVVPSNNINEIKDRKHLDWIKTFLATGIEHKYATVCWSEPESESWNLIMDPQPTVYKENDFPLIHNLPSGFIISPFSSSSDKHYIHSRIHLQSGNHQEWKVQVAYEYLKNLITANHSKTNNSEKILTTYLNFSNPEEDSHLSCYTDGVLTAKEWIKKDRIQKVVLARSKDQVHQSPHIEQILLNLRQTYPHAFIAAYFHPETGFWITATPELLLSSDNKGIFKTVALAGTQPYNPSIPVREVSWTHKEIEEQALVCRYIIGCFKTIRLREYDEQGPRTIRSGNLWHLKTEFIVDTTEVGMPELASTMLQLLHPTSAVCGMPKKAALEFLQEYENFDRELFSGFIGPININGCSELYVNIRCARIYSNKITLFAGAGITAESIPQKEWEETSLKMSVIGQAFTDL
jgi:isochorismate synthase